MNHLSCDSLLKLRRERQNSHSKKLIRGVSLRRRCDGRDGSEVEKEAGEKGEKPPALE
jgi:hypothetical protein